jgi:hypothetical protein
MRIGLVDVLVDDQNRARGHIAVNRHGGVDAVPCRRRVAEHGTRWRPRPYTPRS